MKLNTKLVGAAITVFIVVVILFTVVAALYPTASDSGDQLGDEYQCETSHGCFYNATVGDEFNRTFVCSLNNRTTDDSECGAFNTVPLNGLFAGGGIIFLLFAAVLVIVIFRKVRPK